MKRQSTDTLLMIRPQFFRKNEQTAINNYYQLDTEANDIAGMAEREFDAFVQHLRDHGIQVIVWHDERGLDTPDRIFPNNWISFHDQQLVLYPMFAINRRAERNHELIPEIEYVSNHHYEIYDITRFEEQGLFLEGTGSLVLDRMGNKAFAAISPRTQPELVKHWSEHFNYKPILFHAFQTVNENRAPIYHTNVMMSIGTHFAVICDASIDDEFERQQVMDEIHRSGRAIIKISEDQVSHFCGNILEVMNDAGETFIVMSETAFDHFTPEQKKQLSSFGSILHSPIQTIELSGGGSARCMLAEVF